MPTLTVGPSQGSLLLLTGLEGPAAQMGHAVTLRFTEWTCHIQLDGDVPASVALEGQLPSLSVVTSDGGASLSDGDRRSIRDNALRLLRASRAPTFSYTSTSIQAAAGGWLVLGALTLAGATRSVAVQVTVKELHAVRRISGRASIDQSHFGIKPYSRFLGSLRVRDRVDVVADLEVSLPH